MLSTSFFKIPLPPEKQSDSWSSNGSTWTDAFDRDAENSGDQEACARFAFTYKSTERNRTRRAVSAHFMNWFARRRGGRERETRM